MTRPSRILFATTGSLGDLYPFLAIGRGLQERGHRVSVATTRQHAATVAAAGLTFHAMRPDPTPTAEFHARFMHPTRSAPFVFKEYLSPAIADSYADLLAACIMPGQETDLLVSQSLALAVPLVAKQTGLRWASAVFQPMTLFSAYDPPPLPFVPFITRPHGKTAIEWNRRILSYARTYTQRWVEPVQRYKASLGLDTSHHPIYEGQYAPDLNLAAFSPLLGRPQPDWPANTLQTGTAFYDGAAADPAALHRLQDFVKRGDPPLIFTLGGSSANDAGDFYVLAAQLSRRLQHRAVLLTGGLAAQDRRLADLPDSILRLDTLPYQDVFKHGAVIVHAGGIGTAMRALQAGKPQIMVPSAHDQLDNARRVARLGVGHVLPRRVLNARRLSALLTSVLQDRDLLATAQSLAPSACSEDGIAAAVAVLESLLPHA